MKPTLNFLKEIASVAGDIIQQYVGDDLNIEHKGRTDLVTIADHDSEAYLIDAIHAAFPDHAIIAEESGGKEGQADHQWYLDPLDGTLNYAHGLPIYCVSIGYAFKGQMTLGVIYDPTRNHYFCAQRGQGATLNGKPIHVSGYSNLIDCLLVTGFPNDVWDTPEDNTANFFQFTRRAQSVRRLGSAALDIAYVAAGWLDGFWEVEIFQWDIAAGGLLVQESGGVVTDTFGNPDYMKKPVSILCANAAIHAQMLEVLAEVRERNWAEK